MENENTNELTETVLKLPLNFFLNRLFVVCRDVLPTDRNRKKVMALLYGLTATF